VPATLARLASAAPIAGSPIPIVEGVLAPDPALLHAASTSPPAPSARKCRRVIDGVGIHPPLYDGLS
jgi:hypothetical protein